jgi:outer membrane protein TolC
MTASVVSIGATGTEAKDDDKLTKLFEERASLAKKAYDAYETQYHTGRVSFDTVLGAANEVAEAELLLCKTKAQRIGVREKQVKIAKDREEFVKARYPTGVTEAEVHTAGVGRVKAEIALELEKRDAPSAMK